MQGGGGSPSAIRNVAERPVFEPRPFRAFFSTADVARNKDVRSRVLGLSAGTARRCGSGTKRADAWRARARRRGDVGCVPPARRIAIHVGSV